MEGSICNAVREQIDVNFMLTLRKICIKLQYAFHDEHGPVIGARVRFSSDGISVKERYVHISLIHDISYDQFREWLYGYDDYENDRWFCNCSWTKKSVSKIAPPSE